MSTWAEMFENESPVVAQDPAPSPRPGLSEQVRERALDVLQSTPKRVRRPTQAAIPAVSIVPIALDGPVRSTNGAEPDDHVVRMRHMERPDVELARCIKGGWWWALVGEVPTVETGWAWESHRNETPPSPLRRVFPELDILGGPLARSMALALPMDGLWWRIGTHNGIPVWGWHDDDDEQKWATLCQPNDPDSE